MSACRAVSAITISIATTIAIQMAIVVARDSSISKGRLRKSRGEGVCYWHFLSWEGILCLRRKLGRAGLIFLLGNESGCSADKDVRNFKIVSVPNSRTLSACGIYGRVRVAGSSSYLPAAMIHGQNPVIHIKKQSMHL
jgi:hypothetical protein